MPKPKPKLNFPLSIFFVLVILVLLGEGKFVYAGDFNKIGVSAPAVEASTWWGALKANANEIVSQLYNKAKDAYTKAGSVALNAAIRTTLNTLAYDTATYLATGAPGQKSLFYKEDWGQFMSNVADNAVGNFLDKMAQDGLGGKSFNLCSPDASITMRIGLGIKAYARPKTPTCTWTNLKKTWTNEYTKLTSMQSKDFLQKFQGMFEPNSNDLGVALSVHSMLLDKQWKDQYTNAQNRQEGQGWLDFMPTISNDRKSYPTQAKAEQAQIDMLKVNSFGQYTGDALGDAANIFINQFALSLFNKLMRDLAKSVENTTSEYDFTSSDAAATNSGIAGAKEAFREIIQPVFNERGDYNILAELTNCPNPTKAGPTECVLTENFRKAISENMTVAQAIKKGYLNPNGVFGFKADGLEPNYNAEDYPYRSMIILRKFRILPLSWEIAAENVNKHIAAGVKTLQNMIDEGEISPDWVLKAPQNYCRREGPGPQVMTSEVSGEGTESKLSINRNENYCADEQTCIKEDGKGTCKAYGYCTEERPAWKFDAESCEPIYNTCETFSKDEGGTVSLLKNTLDYGTSPSCDATAAGCKEYCNNYTYDTIAKSIKASCALPADPKFYLNGKVEECDADSEGCHEYIRTKAGIGANLLIDASFEGGASSAFWAGGGATIVADSNAYNGSNVAQGVNKLVDVGASTLSIANQSYTLSFYAKNCSGVAVDLGDAAGGNATHKTLANDASWTFYQLTNNFINTTNLPSEKNKVLISIPGGTCLIDAIKLEEGEVATAWSDYRGNGLIYQKLTPKYLTNPCTGTTPPAECKNFVNECQAEDVGCKWYTALKNDMRVPAKVSNDDYCPKECVGYNNYVQTETVFDSSREAYLIPKKEKSCSADSAGCDEFTNLDKLGSGAEAIEYYSELRQCYKPGSATADCAEFYTWEGSSESGFQLKVMSLQNSPGIQGSAYDQPAVTVDDSAECDSIIYHKPATDPVYNPDCREFYNKAGGVYYHLLSRTYSCSDNCHPYRRTEMNYDDRTVTSCPADQWDAVSLHCHACIGGGVFNSDKTACLYDAIPGEGRKCTASQAGCREYTGSEGADMRVIANSDFEGGDTAGWATGVANEKPSNESLIAGGHSLAVIDANSSPTVNTLATLKLGSLLVKDRSYTLSFLVKIKSYVSYKIYIKNAGADILFDDFPKVYATGEWFYLSTSISRLNNNNESYAVGENDSLVIEIDNGEIYLDNIKLTEISDRYYLIKHDPWNVPSVCKQDVFGNPVDYKFNAGCEAYSTDADGDFYLRKFTKLCSDTVVGCEAMIDTKNSTSFGAYDPVQGAWGSVGADEFKYVVYDESKQCNKEDKGCQRLGKTDQYEATTIYEDVFLKNDPDKYDNSLCYPEQKNCVAWSNDAGQANYFKDPGNQRCEYRLPTAGKAKSTTYDWFKIAVKKCVSTNTYCAKESDCAKRCSSDKTKACTDATVVADCKVGDICVNDSCVLDKTDYQCQGGTAYTQIKTFGYGDGNEILQPEPVGNYNWAGICPASESSCMEYIDPVSNGASNILTNPDCADLDGVSNGCDGWPALGQNVVLENNSLYVISNTLTIKCKANSIRSLNQDNTLGTASQSITGSANRMFYFKPQAATDSCTVTGGAIGSYLKKVIVDYQKGVSLVNDCNGNVDYSNGCVLFNERQISSSKNVPPITPTYVSNKYNAVVTGGSNQLTPVVPSLNDPKDSNVILKVQSDRKCNKWLGCQTYSKDEKMNNVCYNVGLCNRIDENGNCTSFVKVSQANQEPLKNDFSLEKAQLLSGYNLGGYPDPNKTDLFPLAAMNQYGQFANTGNGDFELAESNKYPMGWTMDNKVWDVGLFSVIDNPITAQEEGVTYPRNGKSFLKISPSASIALSEYIDVVPGAEYSLSADINTINFHPGTGYSYIAIAVGILTYDKDGKIVGLGGGSGGFDIAKCDGQAQPENYSCGIVVGGGKDWTKQTQRFKLGANTRKIKIRLGGFAWWGGDSICSPSVGCTERENPAINNCLTGTQYTSADIKVTSDTCAGNVYVDNIKLSPALNSRDSGTVNAITAVSQSCRLYPKADSLSCEYIEDSGKIQKGWYGYCLQYDRYPGDTNACLLWYPVDRVNGDGFDEGAGYLGKYPVYYSMQGQTERLYEYRHVYVSQNVLEEGCKSSNCAPGYRAVAYWCDQDPGNDPTSCVCEPTGTAIKLDGSKTNYSDIGMDCKDIMGVDNPFGTDPPMSEHDGWYNIEGDLRTFPPFYAAPVNGGGPEWKQPVINDSNKYASFLCQDPSASPCDTATEHFRNSGTYCCTLARELVRSSFYATDIVKTVTPLGQNKFWAARVFEGSDFKIPGLGYGYNTDSAPFGSITPPAPVSSPYSWDGSDKDGLQPLYYTADKTKARPGQIYTCLDPTPDLVDDCSYVVDDSATDTFPYATTTVNSNRSGSMEEPIKRLFAQSYGKWRWQQNANKEYHYVPVTGEDWGVPSTESTYKDKDGQIIRKEYIPGNDEDYRYILPVISNVQYNKSTVIPFIINDNQFINLTFNSKVDSQQLPLVLYAIRWGDEQDTMISGVEMRDRPVSDNPHSFYHLYSYWDLKAKVSGSNDYKCQDNICIDCTSQTECSVWPQIKIMDNWGICNTDAEKCNSWVKGGKITVKGPDSKLVSTDGGGLTPTPTPTPTPTTCTSWTYSAWGTCINSLQTRSILTYIPSGCTGGTPGPISQACSVNYTDADNDGYCTAATVAACPANVAYPNNNTLFDCEDGQSTIHPNQTEVQCSPATPIWGIDQNCNGNADEYPSALWKLGAWHTPDNIWASFIFVKTDMTGITYLYLGGTGSTATWKSTSGLPAGATWSAVKATLLDGNIVAVIDNVNIVYYTLSDAGLSYNSSQARINNPVLNSAPATLNWSKIIDGDMLTFQGAPYVYFIDTDGYMHIYGTPWVSTSISTLGAVPAGINWANIKGTGANANGSVITFYFYDANNVWTLTWHTSLTTGAFVWSDAIPLGSIFCVAKSI